MDDNKEEQLYKYIYNYWINTKGISFINYYGYIKTKNYNGLKYLFITNNIIESLHSKISNYLPKGRATSKGFILAINPLSSPKEGLQKYISIFGFRGPFNWRAQRLRIL